MPRGRPTAGAGRALHYAFADALDDAAEDLGRAAVVRALDALARRRARHRADGTDKPKGAAMTGRTAAYARRAIEDRRAKGLLALPGALGTPFAGWSKAKAALDKAAVDARAKAGAHAGTSSALLVPWSVHDLRRTVATGLQRLGVRLEVTEAVLNHISGSRGGIAGVYQRHDWAGEKRAALDAWAAHALAMAGQRTPADNVVKLTRAG
jgi:hypothetical protein